jgi:hypothetical protein
MLQYLRNRIPVITVFTLYAALALSRNQNPAANIAPFLHVCEHLSLLPKMDLVIPPRGRNQSKKQEFHSRRYTFRPPSQFMQGAPFLNRRGQRSSVKLKSSKRGVF